MPPLLGPTQLRVPRQLQEANITDDYFKYLASAGASFAKRIKIHHPGYIQAHDLLFALHTPDHPNGGVHFGLVLDACAIIADNRHDGWLSTDREGEDRVGDDSTDQVLAAGDYWYHVPMNEDEASTSRWPVVTCFQDWEFPAFLPLIWQRAPQPEQPANTTAPSTFSSAILARDIFCRISAHYTGTEVAHLCPRGESDWFEANAMSRWNNDTSLGPQSLLDDHGNLILLRSDIHKAFDDGKFILYPKDDKGFTFHMLEPSSDLGVLYHNARTYPIVNCRAEFLYARFAWAIFRSLSGFLAMPTDRTVIAVKNGIEQRRVVEVRNSRDIRERVMASRSRSPRKRKVDPADAGEYGDDEGANKRRCNDEAYPKARISPFEGSASVNTPPLETDAGMHHQYSPDSALHAPSVQSSDDEDGRIRRLRDQHLQSQRPPDFTPFSGSVFEDTADPKIVFERLGIEIVEYFPSENGAEFIENDA